MWTAHEQDTALFLRIDASWYSIPFFSCPISSLLIFVYTITKMSYDLHKKLGKWTQVGQLGHKQHGLRHSKNPGHSTEFSGSCSAHYTCSVVLECYGLLFNHHVGSSFSAIYSSVLTMRLGFPGSSTTRLHQSRAFGHALRSPIYDVMLSQYLLSGSAIPDEPEAENKARQCGGSAARCVFVQVEQPSPAQPGQARPGETGPDLVVLCCLPVNAALPPGLEKNRISRPKPVSDQGNLGVESLQPNPHPPHEVWHRFQAKRTRKTGGRTHADNYDLPWLLFAMRS